MIVPPHGVEIWVYCLTFGGVIMFCVFFVVQACVNKSGKLIVWFRPLFTAPACAG